MLNIVDQIIFNFSNNKSLYIGENLTISEHMIQAAMLAEKNKSSDDLICSSLLHDYGHFVIEDPNQLVSDKVDGKHEIIGANYLKNYFHNKIIEPILLHVEAKKYLSREKALLEVYFFQSDLFFSKHPCPESTSAGNHGGGLVQNLSAS